MNKKKKVVNTSIYPDEVIERLARCFYPAILECFNSEEGQRAFAAWQAEQARSTGKEKQDVPTGERPALHTDCKDFCRQGAPFGVRLSFVLRASRHRLPRPALVRLRTGKLSVLQPTEENEKSEPFSYWKKVRIFLVWCG